MRFYILVAAGIAQLCAAAQNKNIIGAAAGIQAACPLGRVYGRDDGYGLDARGLKTSPIGVGNNIVITDRNRRRRRRHHRDSDSERSCSDKSDSDSCKSGSDSCSDKSCSDKSDSDNCSDHDHHRRRHRRW